MRQDLGFILSPPPNDLSKNVSRGTSRRLSGPLLDRFDMLVFSHQWLKKSDRVRLKEVQETVQRLAEFARRRGDVALALPKEYEELALSHRRRRSMLRVARAFADYDESVEIRPEHFHRAAHVSTLAMTALAQLFG